jgi:gluconolactonase
MSTYRYFPFVVSILILVGGCKNAKELTTQYADRVGTIEMNDPGLLTVIDTGALIEVLADSFVWSEGPLWLEKEQKLLFTDVPKNIIYAWDEANGKSIYLTPSGYTIADTTGGTEGANGLSLDAAGNLILCQHGNRSVAMMTTPVSKPTPDFKFLATRFGNKRFNSPNDLHIAKDGDIFFTDPPYGLPGLDTASAKEISFNGVYRLHRDGKVSLLDSTMTKPNGIVLSADERTMYVANSDPKEAYWKKYVLDEHKNIVSSAKWADATDLVDARKGLPDGMKIGHSGHIFASGPGGILIFDASGKKLGTVMTGKATANCALDTKNHYLYMTAHDCLMRVKLR